MRISEKIKGHLRRRPRQLDLEEYLAKLLEKGLHPDGTPVLDPTPMAPPIGYTKQPSMVEIVRDMVRSAQLAQAAEAAGAETFEEADDFDVGDEPDFLLSGWENDFDPPLVELLEAGRQVVAEREAEAAAQAAAQAPEPAPVSSQRKTAKAAPKAPVPPSDGPDD